MTTRKVAFFFIEITTIHYPTPTTAHTSKSMQVVYQYFDDDAEEHLNTYGRYSYGTRHHSYILKQPNIALIDVPFTTWGQHNDLCKSIANYIQHSFHPFKPISNFNLTDYPEALL